MKCSNCGNELTPEMLSSRMCFTCGQSTSDSEKAFYEEQNKLREEQKKKATGKNKRYKNSVLSTYLLQDMISKAIL